MWSQAHLMRFPLTNLMLFATYRLLGCSNGPHHHRSGWRWCADAATCNIVAGLACWPAVPESVLCDQHMVCIYAGRCV
jgi:hypothetical protein